MSYILRLLLITCSVFALILCFKKIEQSKLKISDSIGWIIGCIILILMSVFSNIVIWLSSKLGFMAPVNFIFFTFIVFLIMQVFSYKIKISELNEKLKDIDHYIALKENQKEQEKNK